jgi:hypothetical protein
MTKNPTWFENEDYLSSSEEHPGGEDGNGDVEFLNQSDIEDEEEFLEGVIEAMGEDYEWDRIALLPSLQIDR